MGATYTVNLNTANGERLAVLENILSLKAARAVNEVGALTLTMPGSFDYRVLNVDYQLEIYRHPDGVARQSRQQTPLLDTIWLIRGWGVRRDGGKRVIDIMAVSLLDLLQRRVCYGIAGESVYQGARPADNIIKALVRYGLGANAAYSMLLVPGYTGRSYTLADYRDHSAYLTVEADTSQCLSITYDAKNKNLYDACKELAGISRSPQWDGTPGIPLYFDIVPDEMAGWTFKTFVNQRGVDRSSTSLQPLIASERRENLADTSIVFDFSDEITYAIIIDDVLPQAGDAYDLDRITASPFNRREIYAELNQYILDAARFESRALLDQNKRHVKIAGVVIDSSGCRFGVDWNWGDRIVAEVEDERQDVLLKAVSVEYASGQEKIGAQFTTGD